MKLAWISVHDHVVGGKLRELAKDIGCSQKEALGIIVSLWLWGLNNADRTGKLRSCDRNDLAEEVFSKGISAGLNRNSIVDSLIEQKWVDEEGGDLYIHDWDTWQEQWYKFLKTKEYDAARKREERARKKAEAQKQITEQEGTSMYVPSDSPTNSSTDSPTNSPVDSPMDNPPNKQKKTKKVEKKQYADYVSLKEEEYQKLVFGYGEKAADKFIEELNLYKGSTGKTYKSDYMTILNWVTDKVEKKYPGLIQRPTPDMPKQQKSIDNENPFGQWKE